MPPMSNRSALAVVCVLLLTACAPFNAASPFASTPAQIAGAVATTTPVNQPSDSPAQAPTATTPPQLTPASTNEIAALDASTRRTRDQIELARALGSCRANPAACPSVAATTPPDLRVGEVRPFYITDMSDNVHHEIQAALRYAGPVVLMYVEQGVTYNQADLERAAQVFETEIYPRTRAIFGSEAQPGVDGDPRVTVLNARDPDSTDMVVGYYSSQDSLPRQVNRYSNERELFFMNIARLSFARPEYLDVLAHEFQHMIHQNEHAGSATWFNEGCAQLAEDLNGFTTSSFPGLYLANPDVQLTDWAASPSAALLHYGAAHLFMRYIYAQYAGKGEIRPLIEAGAGDKLQAFVELAAHKRPDVRSFPQIVGDWAVANLIDNPTVGDGRYSYDVGDMPGLLPGRVVPLPLALGGTIHSDVAQYGADYFALPAGTHKLTFIGTPSVSVTAVLPHDRFAWWSNRSDDSLATLTRPFDLRGLRSATLSFATWYELETNYDYAFVTVSTDGGATWETLPGTLTTTSDPQGTNYGNALTGVSGQSAAAFENGERGTWVTEQMNLAPYAGKEVLLRFWQINDQAFDAPGMLIDDLRIPELGYSDNVESGDGGWQAQGFARIDGHLPQLWELRLVRTAADGTISVEPVTVDALGAATATLAEGEQGVFVVIGATPYTSEHATYHLTVT